MADEIDPLEIPPDEEQVPVRKLIERIEHNTYVIRQWVRFFGIVWLIGLVLAIIAITTKSPSYIVR